MNLFFTLIVVTTLSLCTLPGVDSETNTTDAVEALEKRISRQKVGTKAFFVSNSVVSFQEIVIDFRLVALIGLDEEKQVLSFSGTLIAVWQDDKIAWDPVRYGNISAITMKTDMLWVPKLSAANSVGQWYSTIGDEAFVFADGLVSALYADTYQTSCQIDTSFFPFDEQTCDVLFFPNGPYMLFAKRSEISTTAYFFPSNEWNLLSITMQNRSFIEMLSGYPLQIDTLAIKFKMKRYHSFYVLTILCPIGIMSLMNSFVFLLPVESGEKMSYLVTIFVAYAMFLNFIYNSMPKSDSTSRLALYLLLVISQSCLSILVTLYLINVHHDYVSCGSNKTSVRRRKTIVEDENTIGKKRTEALSQAKTSMGRLPLRTVDRIMFVLFAISAVLSLLVFVDY